MSPSPHQVAIASCTAHATDAGQKIVEAGGNAFDAAVATAFNLMVSHPLMCSIGGSGFATLKEPGKEPVVVDFFSAMPGKWLSKEAFGKNYRVVSLPYGPGVEVISGYGSISVPGTAKGLGYIAEQYGKLPLSDILAPTITDARRGVAVNGTIGLWLGISAEKLHWYTPYSRQLLSTEEGAVPQEGDVLKNTDLANTLEYLGQHGCNQVYQGELAQQITRVVSEGGGIITPEDLASYDVILRKPMTTSLAGYTLYTNPLPSVGGCTISQLLKVLSRLNINPKTGYTPAQYSQLGLAIQTALEDRFAIFRDNLSPEALEDETRLIEKYKHILPSANTTQLCSADSEGNLCSITMSMGYGSGVAIDGTGIFMDNTLGELELNPKGFHALEPGERLVSNMSPSIAVGDNDLIAIGTPGASRISTTLAQVLFNTIHLGMSLSEALAAPRIHWEDGKLVYETHIQIDPTIIPPEWEQIHYDALNMYFGGVQATRLSRGALDACSDPRRSGCASVINAASPPPSPHPDLNL